MKAMLRIFVLFAFSWMLLNPAQAQTFTITQNLTWTGGWCSICPPTTPNNYACTSPGSSGFVNWNNGIRTFTDPVPSGFIVTGIDVEVDKHNCGYTSMSVALNGTAIGSAMAPGLNTCSCANSPCGTQTWSNTTACPVGVAGYVYGGVNSLQLTVVGNTACVKSALVTITYEACCPPPAPPNGINGPATVCPGDTLNFSVTPVPGATSYGWSVTGDDTIIAGVDSSIMTLVIDSASVGDTICVYLNDSCTSSPDTCFVYGINFPAPPGAITGDTLVCSSDTVQYSVAFVPGAVSYNWIPPKGSTILTGQGTNIVEIVMDSASGDVCLTLTDSCATSDTTCLAIEIDTMPTVANAGMDVTLCSGLATTLNGNAPAVGTGIWTLASGGGTIVDPTMPATGFTNIQVGSNELVWTITGEAGCPTFSDTVVVDASQSPTALFSAPGSCDQDSTQLTDLSNGNGFPLASWDWDVDGDAVADYTTATANHLYTTLGPKTIRLIVTNALGCSDTISQTSWVNPNPATAFTANDVCDEEVMTFTDNTTIVTGSVVSYLWNFGDLSGLDNNQNTLHLYNNPGVYNVQFTATSDSGCSVTSTQPVEVYHNPLVDFTAPATCRNRTVAFSDHSAVTNSTLINWDWTFGDGLPNLGLQNPTHDYLNHGTYQVTLEVTSVQGCSSELTKPIVIHPVPIPDYSTVAAACVGELVNFTDQSTIATGSVVKWDWFLDQGVWLSEKDPTYIYGDYGDFDVLLVAVSDQGCRDTLSQPIRINPIPDALFSVNDVCQDEPALIQDASTVAEGSILNRTWNLGDGATFGNQNFISHLYKDPGVYPIYLQVTSDAGCVNDREILLNVFEQPEVRFTMSPDSGCTPLEVEFTNLTTISNNTLDISYDWHFDLGTRSDNVNPVLTFRNNGTDRQVYDYDILLRATTSEGCVTDYRDDKRITVFPRPGSAFRPNPLRTDLLTPTVIFRDESKAGTYFYWDFGDGTLLDGPEIQVEHTYTEPGSYITTQIAENDFLCRDSSMVEVVIDPNVTIYIPTAFSPNGDGVNDIFQVEHVDAVLLEFRLQIFNRWGEMLYDESGLHASWDGLGGNGESYPQGIYTYRIYYRDANGVSKELIGNVTIVSTKPRRQ